MKTTNNNLIKKRSRVMRSLDDISGSLSAIERVCENPMVTDEYKKHLSITAKSVIKFRNSLAKQIRSFIN